MVNISGVIITYNEEKNIERCIKSLDGIVDEILVVDSFSTDSTRNICERLGVRFITNKFEGYRHQKNFAISQAKYDCVLSLDADEAISDRLKESINSVKKDWKYDGYVFNRYNNFYGKWIRFTVWYPDRKMRLFDRKKGEWTGVNLHEKYELYKGQGNRSKFLKGDLLHWILPDVEEHIRRANNFSSIAAKELYDAGVKATIWTIFIHTSWAFIRSYIVRLGFLDGHTGFVVSKLTALTVFLKYEKLRRKLM